MARDITALVEAVKAHAIENYIKGGWDYVVETMDDERIIELIGRARTPKGAIKKVAEVADLLGERRADIVAAGDPYDYSQDLVDDVEDVPAPVLVIEADQAISAEALREDGYYVPAQKTTTGPNCGNCAKAARALGNKEPQRHATADLVRYCYEYDAMEKDRSAQQAAEYHAEMLVERHFEERGAWEPEPMDMWSYAAGL